MVVFDTLLILQPCAGCPFSFVKVKHFCYIAVTLLSTWMKQSCVDASAFLFLLPQVLRRSVRMDSFSAIISDVYQLYGDATMMTTVQTTVMRRTVVSNIAYIIGLMQANRPTALG